jgi:SPX domain protein involved in polyphosphate accumulation
MLSRHEEKYILTYAQYAVLCQRARQVLTVDPNGQNGSYTITSLYFDDPEDTGLSEKLDGLKLHSKFRLRTYNHTDAFIKLERKDKQGILTKKISAPIEKAQLPLLTQPGAWAQLDGTAQSLVQQLQSRLYRPTVAVRYVRDAFYYPGTDLRLTFDQQLEAIVPDAQALFDPDLRGTPVLSPGSVVMEIKYGNHLPAFLRKLTYCNAPQLSLSKYALCRGVTTL